MEKSYQVTIGDVVKTYSEGTTYLMIANEFQQQYEHDIVLVFVDGKLQELYKKVKKNCKISFVTTVDDVGNKTYKRGVSFLMVKAIYDVAGKEQVKKVWINFSLDKGFYCSVDGNIEITEEFLQKVEERMREMVVQNLPIMKSHEHIDDAIAIFKEQEMKEKERLFNYRRGSTVNLYNLDGLQDYYYGYMVPSTGFLKYFKLYKYGEGFVLQMPDTDAPEVVTEFEPADKLYRVLKEAVDLNKVLGVDTVADLNDYVTRRNPLEMILVQEALQEKKIAEIAEQIAENPAKKFVLIAGPSSSGKTTFSHRLSIQLRAHGLIPHPIAVDNYFVNREDTPLDEEGKPNYECLEAVDIKKLNEDLVNLMNGESVEIPSFNFKTGKREYKGNFKKLGDNDILVIEGIHCLNDALTYDLPKENKFKIYISALTSLNIDEHNRIPTTDGRLLRRMVRDARTRGTSAKNTIAMWKSVRRGEENNIFPYQEEADAMFNSALLYELAVIKHYAEPVLFGIEKDCEEYVEAKRLLKFLDYFVGIGSEDIPKNSLLREFIGGGCFEI